MEHINCFIRKQIRVWSRTAANAQTFAEQIGATACETAEQAVSGADVIVTVTASSTPVLLGKWIKPGAHINGNFMSKSDDSYASEK